MVDREETLRALREAMSLSPNNVVLRKHCASLLLEMGRLDEAEQEFKAALALEPQNVEIKIGLARVCHLQGKRSVAIVILEDLVNKNDALPEARLFLARLQLDEGDVEGAIHHYKTGVEADPEVRDADLEEQLGLYREGDANVIDGRVPAHDAGREPSDIEPLLEKPLISFAEVGGMEDLKEEIRVKIIHPLEHPEVYAAYGKTIGGGILLYGPPGCGKTYLARATAGEVSARFLAIGLNDVLDMWLGNSERNLHELFEVARNNRPCVLFFDEVDALGARRSDMRQSGARQLINQFLAELDGVQASNEGVLILAATNAPWHLDSAFRRPGRFDRVLFVPPPDATARAAILEVMLREKPTVDIDLQLIARKAPEFSGADLKALVDLAVEVKLKEAIRKGIPEPIRTNDLKNALKRLKSTTKEWFATARNYALYSNQGGIYDDILHYLKLR